MHFAVAPSEVQERPGVVPPFEGRVLAGTYRILHEIGRGAMGIVYEAQHLRLYRRVAVKVLPGRLAARPDVRARFEQESDLVSRIRSRHVVDILDYDVTPEGEPYLVLELLQGETLASRMTQGSRLTVPDCLSIVRQIAVGLHAAHRSNVVHRDLKPDNVFLVQDDAEPGCLVKLLDFGIGKSLGSGPRITGDRQIIGTPDYMAPEQAAGNRARMDGRTDQHALAVVAYELLTGTNPFAADDFTEALRRILTETPAPASTHAPWLPREVDGVLGRALLKDPDLRFPDVLALAAALSAALEGSTALPDAEAAGAIEQDLLARLGSMDAVLELVAKADPTGIPEMSPRTAFLLSRLEAGMTLASVLDVAAMPRLEALRRLVALVAAGVVRFVRR